jgi:hypothetical protein
MSNKPEPELIIVQVMDEGVCTICGVRSTSMRCRSCSSEHYLCIGCADSHRTAFRGEQDLVQG